MPSVLYIALIDMTTNPYKETPVLKTGVTKGGKWAGI